MLTNVRECLQMEHSVTVTVYMVIRWERSKYLLPFQRSIIKKTPISQHTFPKTIILVIYHAIVGKFTFVWPKNQTLKVKDYRQFAHAINNSLRPPILDRRWWTKPDLLERSWHFFKIKYTIRGNQLFLQYDVSMIGG